MRKDEFINTLRSKLMGEVTAPEIENTVRYYEDYIAEAVRSGRSEEEVLAELGSPLLIAKTIIETANRGGDGPGRVYETGQSSRQEEERTNNIFNLPSKWVVIAVIVVIFLLLITILRILIPIFLPIILICLVISMFRRGGRR